MNRHQEASAGGSSGWLTVLLCASVGLMEGIDLQAAGVAAPKLGPAMGLGPGDLGLFFSSSTFGLIFGALIGGRISDRFGRKPALLLAVALFGLMSIFTGMAGNYHMLVTARFLTGVGLGGALPNVIALVAESVDPARRSTAVGTVYATLPGGGAISSLISMMGGDADNWRWIFYLGGALPLLLIPMLAKGLHDTAPRKADNSQAAARPSVAHVLFGEGRALNTVLLWVSFFLALLVLYLLLNWLPTLLVGRGMAKPDAAIVQFVFNAAGLVGCIAIGFIMDRPRKVAGVIGVFGIGVLSLASLAGAPATLVISVVIGIGLGIALNGAQAILYGLAPNGYPIAIRGTGVGSVVAVGRTGSAIGPLLGGLLVSLGLDAGGIMLVLTPIFAIAGLVTAWGASRLGFSRVH